MISNMDGSHSSTSNDHQDFTSCYEARIAQQEEDLKQLTQAITTCNNNDDQTLPKLVETSLNHYQDYVEKRTAFARRDALCFFSPTWSSSFENSYLWIAGCRPSLFIRLVYSLSGLSLEAHIEEYLQGVRRGNLGELSPVQLGLINRLHCSVVKEEERQTSMLASLQERMADQKFVKMANEFWERSLSATSTSDRGDIDEVTRKVLEEEAFGLGEMMEKADKFRMKTLRELVGILTPFQAVEFIIASNKLHLSIHEWCKRK